MQKIIILKGLPGSGKSTWAKEYCHKNKDYIRVNRDDLRNMRGDYWVPKQEDLITDMENTCVLMALKNGKNVILDATNLDDERTKSHIEYFYKNYPSDRLKIEYKTFDVPLEKCIENDLKRPNSVGHKVIERMYKKHLAQEGVRSLNNFYEEDETLPRCVIFDIDGTLALMNGRSPYDFSRVKEDLPHTAVINLARTLYYTGKKIVIMSGRDDSCMDLTKEWLEEHGVKYHDIFMRKTEDNRKDSIVKKEMFEENVRGKYYCEFVVDDRNMVVDTWRKELGLTCLQCNYGDF